MNLLYPMAHFEIEMQTFCRIGNAVPVETAKELCKAVLESKMRENSKYTSRAKLALPSGYAVLATGERLKPNDIVWSWCSNEWLRADSELWKFPPLEYGQDIICAARKIEMSEFEWSVPRQRSYSLR